MKYKLTLWNKIMIVLVCFAIAIAGFMVKLPSPFRHVDKELHATFYFCAAALLNFLFAKTKIVRHVLIFIALGLFGIAIEYAQEYSNKLFRTTIHGRFAPEDVRWNLKGLIAFSILWILYTVTALIYRRLTIKDKDLKSEPL